MVASGGFIQQACLLFIKSDTDVLADRDGSYWGGDRSIPSPRLVYTINNNNPGTDAAAGAAAAFAACSNLYAGRGFNSSTYSAPASLKNASYADTLLSHGQALYSFAVNATNGRKTYQTSVPQAASIYGSSGYGDELAIAALFLALATGSNVTYQEAESYWTHYNLASSNRVFNWDSKTPGLPVLFAQANAVNPALGGNYTTWQAVAESYFDDLVNKNGGGFMTQGKPLEGSPKRLMLKDFFRWPFVLRW